MKSILKIPEADRNRIFGALELLQKNPRKGAVRKLTGLDSWRLRVGNYRVIYEIHDDSLVILLISAGHRKDVYN